MTHCRVRRPLTVVLLAATGLPAQDESSASDLDGVWQAFAQAGLLSPRGMPFIRWTGGRHVAQGVLCADLSRMAESGFLVSGRGGPVFLTLIGMQKPWTKGDRGESLDLATYAGAVLEDAANPMAGVGAGLLFDAGPHLQLPAALLLFAWSCHENGRDDLAGDLARAARRVLPRGVTSLKGAVAVDFATMGLWQIYLDIGRPEVDWQDLLVRAEALVPVAAGTALAERVGQTVAALRATAAAAAAQAAAPEPVDEAGRIARLIGALREQNGQQMMQPGCCDPLADPRGERSPAAQLAARGLAAIPQLLAVLDSRELTRCIGCECDSYFSHDALRVGDVARSVFAKITGYRPGNRAEGESWWQGYQAKRAAATWAVGAAKGDVEMAERLVAIDPERALASLTAALLTRPDDEQPALLEVLSGVDDPRATELLRRRLAAARWPRARLIAANALCLRGEVDVAIDGLIATLRSPDTQLHSPEIAKFLIGSGRTRALTAVAAHRSLWSAELATCAAEGRVWSVSSLAPGGRGKRASWVRDGLEAGYAAECERVLGPFLDQDDRDVDTPSFATAEAVARGLHRMMPEVYAWSATDATDGEARLTAVKAVRETWRTRRAASGR